VIRLREEDVRYLVDHDDATADEIERLASNVQHPGLFDVLYRFGRIVKRWTLSKGG